MNFFLSDKLIDEIQQLWIILKKNRK